MEEKSNRFCWNQGDKVLTFVQCLAKYKSVMEYGHIDLNADKVKQYEAVRRAMSDIYSDQPDFFGPISVTQLTQEVAEDKKKKTEFIVRQKKEQ